MVIFQVTKSGVQEELPKKEKTAGRANPENKSGKAKVLPDTEPQAFLTDKKRKNKPGKTVLGEGKWPPREILDDDPLPVSPKREMEKTGGLREIEKNDGMVDYGYVVGKTDLTLWVSGDSRGTIYEALNLLAKKAPEDLDFIARCLKRLEVSEEYADVYHPERDAFEMSQRLYDRTDIYFLAGAFAHEAYHAYNAAMDLHQGDSGEAATNNELTAIKYQLSVMKKIGAPESRIQYLEKADGRHWDENGDGIFDERDTDLRRRKRMVGE